MSEQLNIKTDQEIARDIVFRQFHLGGDLYEERWVDCEAETLAEKCAVEAIDAGRRAERQLIADALGIDVSEIDSLVGGTESGDEPSDPILQRLASELRIHGASHDVRHRWGD